jgi:hypothetical protein
MNAAFGLRFAADFFLLADFLAAFFLAISVSPLNDAEISSIPEFAAVLQR